MKGIAEEITVIMLLAASLGIAGGLYFFINGIVASRTTFVEVIDSYCVNHTAYFVVRNGATTPLTKNDFVCKKNDAGCGSCVVDDNFPAGSAGYVKVYDCSSGTHSFSLTGVANGLQLVTYCA